MSLLHHAARKLDHTIRGLMQNGHLESACVTAHFDVATAPVDPNMQEDYPAAAPRTKEYHAFVHFVNLRSSQRQWMDIKAGDVILGMLPEDATEIAEKEGVTFTLPNKGKFQQSDAGGELQQFWDMHIGGAAVMVSFLLRPVP